MTAQKSTLRFILILLGLLLISGAAFYTVSVPRHVQAERAAGGVLDLRGKDFSNDLFTLDGKWGFYYGHLYAPADFADGTPDGQSFISVPVTFYEGTTVLAADVALVDGVTATVDKTATPTESTDKTIPVTPTNPVVPKTGDDGNPALWFVLCGVALLTLGGLTVVSRRKKYYIVKK